MCRYCINLKICVAYLSTISSQESPVEPYTAPFSCFS